MKKQLIRLLFLGLLSAAMVVPALAAGEEILAQTGEYTFFIKPFPTDCTTYYQKPVPCVVKDTIQVPKRVMLRYQVPVPVKRRVPVTVSEQPVGCASGQTDCTTCRPQGSCKPGYKEIWEPKLVTVRVPDVQFVPKEVTRQVMLPQWFAVTETPRAPQKVRKCGIGG